MGINVHSAKSTWINHETSSDMQAEYQKYKINWYGIVKDPLSLRSASWEHSM